MFKQKPAPTFEERLSAANAEAAAAVSVFEEIALDLDNAAHDKLVLESEINAEIDRLEALISQYEALAFEAFAAGVASQNKAQSVRALVGN